MPRNLEPRSRRSELLRCGSPPGRTVQVKRGGPRGSSDRRVCPGGFSRWLLHCGGVAALETTTPDGVRSAAWLVVPPFAAYLLCLTAISFAIPYQPALDDRELFALAQHWSDSATLDPAGLFRRVPFWQMMLGSGFAAVGQAATVALVQAGSVLAVLAMLASRALRGAASPAAVRIVAFVFALSPQALLYSRHAANELFVGALAVAVLVLAERGGLRRAAWAGALVGVAAMSKLAAAVLVAPAIWLLLGRRGESSQTDEARPSAWVRGALFAAGVAAVVVPLVVLALVQRGWPLDDTSAFNLGSLDQATWAASGTSAERSRVAIDSFWVAWDAGPAAYLVAALARGVDWLARPGSLDLTIWIPEYPARVVEVADVLVFFGVLVLAVFGTTRASLPYWLFPIAIWLACSLPQKTPYSPRVAALIPLLLIAPAGIDALRGRRR